MTLRYLSREYTFFTGFAATGCRQPVQLRDFRIAAGPERAFGLQLVYVSMGLCIISSRSTSFFIMYIDKYTELDRCLMQATTV